MGVMGEGDYVKPYIQRVEKCAPSVLLCTSWSLCNPIYTFYIYYPLC